MKKTTIKSKIYIGFLLMVVLSVILYGSLSWFARDYVLDGAKKIQYNSSLATQIENLRELSDEKMIILYQGVLNKQDISDKLVQNDGEIQTICNNILDDINALEILEPSMAVQEVQELISEILYKESEITRNYEALIKSGFMNTYEEELLSSVSGSMEYWDDFIESVMALSDENLLALKALLNNLEDGIDGQNNDVATIKSELESILEETGKVNAILHSLSQDVDKYFAESQSVLDSLNDLLNNAVQATEFPVINTEDIPVYNFSSQKDTVVKDKNAALNSLNALINQGNILTSELGSLVSDLGDLNTSVINNALEQRSLLTEIILSAQEIRTLTVLSGFSKDQSMLEHVINDKVPKIREKTEGIKNRDNLDISKLDVAASSLDTMLSDLKSVIAGSKDDGLRDINRTREEVIPLLETLDKKLQTNFDENIIKSRNIQGYIIPGIVIMSAISVFFGVLIAFIVSKSIIKPIKQMSGQLKKAEDGDLKYRINSPSAPELSQMAKSVNAVLESREQILNEAASVSENIKKTRNELLSSFMKNKDLLNGITVGMHEILDQFKANRVEISKADMLETVELDVAVSQEVIDSTEKSKKAVQDAKETIIRASETVKDIAQQIEQLEESSGKIEEITNAITQIAKRTNLLALNAAIEAAKAGDQGRGFAVLADEIRKLADASGDAAKAIKNQLSDIQMRIQWTVKNMDEGVTGVEQGAESISDVYQSIEDITARVKLVAGTLEDYADKSNKQLMANQKLMDVIEIINKNTSELYQAGQSIDDKLEDSRQSISDMEHIEEMLDITYSKINGILIKYKGES